MSDREDAAARRRLSLRGAELASDVAAGILFFCVLTPLAFFLRRAGRDRLRLRRDPAAASYWIARDRTPGRQTEMTRQS